MDEAQRDLGAEDERGYTLNEHDDSSTKSTKQFAAKLGFVGRDLISKFKKHS